MFTKAKLLGKVTFTSTPSVGTIFCQLWPTLLQTKCVYYSTDKAELAEPHD